MMLERDLIPSELKAIEERRHCMSIEQNRKVPITEAINDFLEKYEQEWLREKAKRDEIKQKEEIDRHKYLRSQQAGRDLGEEAIEEWRQKYAPIWKKEQESLERNGFLERKVTIRNSLGLHVRPSGTLVKIAQKYDCDLYVHKDGMENYNFKMNDKPYINVRSVITPLTELCAEMGDSLEFIAYGIQANDALDEIEDIVKKKFNEE